MLRLVSRQLHLHLINVDVQSTIWTDVIGQQAAKLKDAFEKGRREIPALKRLFSARAVQPCILQLENVHVLGVDGSTGLVGRRWNDFYGGLESIFRRPLHCGAGRRVGGVVQQ